MNKPSFQVLLHKVQHSVTSVFASVF